MSSRAFGVTYTAIDLHPSGFENSDAYGTSGTQQIGRGTTVVTGNRFHALLWSGSADSYVDLTPSGWYGSEAYGISGTQQVGYGYGPATDSADHALLWNGSADSFIDLHPSGFNHSFATGISGTQQVGYGKGPGYVHALLWSGNATSCVDLNPSGFDFSMAYGISGTQQVGLGYGSATGGNNHALLWSGTAESCIDLNPSGFTYSFALGISGTQQVGYGSATDGNNHALLWNGTAASFVDLNPSGFVRSGAYGTNGTQQVGFGSATGGNDHALLWSGTADSFIDLHQFLPDGFTESYARGIDSYGNIVGYATRGSVVPYAILWQPIPEPATVLLLGLGAVMLRRKRQYSGKEKKIKTNILIIMAYLIALTPAALATNVYFDDGQIHLINNHTYQSDYIWLDNYIFNDPGTHLELVNGGKIWFILPYNKSTVTINGGFLGGSNAAIDTAGDNIVRINGGTIIGDIAANNNSRIYVSGGSLNDDIYAYDTGIVEVRGGSVGGVYGAFNSGTIYLYGSDFQIGGQTLSYGDSLRDYGTLSTNQNYFKGIITGTLQNGSAINNSFLISARTNADIIVIPEPATVLLLGLGAAVLRVTSRWSRLSRAESKD
jgi:hypothetical protein